MPDSTTPASQMLRVPTPLIDAVKELSRLHRQGHTRAVLSGLQRLIADIDSKRDSDGANVRDSDITTDSKIDSEMIAGMIAAAIAPIQEKIAQIENPTMFIESTNILATEISRLNERVGILERWRLDLVSFPEEDTPTAGEPPPIAEPAANLEAGSALSPSDRADSLTRAELGERLGVSRESIRIWQRSGELKKRGWEPVPGTGSSPSNPVRYRRIPA